MRRFERVIAIALVMVFAVFPVQAQGLTPSGTTTIAQRNAIAYTWTYYTRGYYENNCLAYSLGNTTTWLWPWGAMNPSLSQVKSYLSGYYGFSYVGPSAVGPLRTTRVYCYGSTSAVTHFARNTTATTSIRTDSIRAKWGRCEVFNHSNANPYTPNPYGPLVGAWVK